MFLEALESQTQAFERALGESLPPDAAAHSTTNWSSAGQLGPPAHLHAHAPERHQQPVHSSLPCFNDLIAVLIECFSLIAIGYLSGRFKLISPDAKDLGAYLTTFALPMIIFLNVAQMEFHTINLAFLVSMLVSKLLLLVLVSAVTLVVSHPCNFSYAGALSILATQSNDFALGYPLFKSLYGESRPEMLNYLNLMGPIQLLVINPVGIVMLEFEKARTSRLARRRASLRGAQQTCVRCLEAARAATRPAPRPPIIPIGLERADAPPARPLAADDTQLISDIRSLGVGRPGNPPPHLDSDQLRRKNIKSLALVMPATVMSERSFSDESLESLEFGRAPREAAAKPTETPTLYSQLSSSTDDSAGDRHAPSGVCTKREWFGPASGGQLASNYPEAEHQREAPHGSGPSAGGCACRRGGASWLDEPLIDLGFVRALLTNPLIVASVVALAVNLLHGPELPKFITKVSNTIAASFAAPALLVVGLSMYGKFELILRNPNDLLLSSAIVATKVLILPNVMRALIQVVLPHFADPEQIHPLADFAYLYGLLPTAPGACIIAKQYEVLTNVVSICMLLSTFISAPLMLGTSAVISKAATITSGAISNILAQALRISSSVTLILSLISLYLLWKSSRRIVSPLRRTARQVVELKASHLFACMLALAQLLVGVGGLMLLLGGASETAHHTGPLHSQLVGDDEDENLVVVALASAAEPKPLDQWPRALGDHVETDDDLLVQEERLHLLAASKTHALLAGPQAASFLCTAGFVSSSGGILLARSFILCVVATNFARHLRGNQLAARVASLMMRVSPLFAGGVALCLILEAKHTTCAPIESSLPPWAVSLYLRLVFNLTTLGLAIPLFATTFRLQNRAAFLRASNETPACDLAPGSSSLRQRRFVSSTVSLTSETSSAVTTGTNLDANLAVVNSGNWQGSPPRVFGGQRPGAHPQASPKIEDNEPAALDSILVEFSNQQEATEHEQQQKRQKIGISRVASLVAGGAGRDTAESDRSCGLSLDRGPLGMRLDEAARQTATRRPLERSSPPPPPPLELNECSLLIVFMLFQTLLGLTSTVQTLQQDKSNISGTFIMVELTNLIMDFGQGLVTFLAILTQAFLKDPAAPDLFGQSRAHTQT